jgi:hypothetical protein
MEILYWQACDKVLVFGESLHPYLEGITQAHDDVVVLFLWCCFDWKLE